MKKLTLILLIGVTFTSCSSYYYYAQVLKTTCANRSEKLTDADPEVVYEDDNCVVFYETWQEKGNGGFGIYNKTDKLLYVNLAKSFFICNGVSYPYYKARTWSASHSSSQQITSGYTTQSTTTSAYGTGTANANTYGSASTYATPYSAYTLGNVHSKLSSSATTSANTYRTSSSEFISTVSNQSSSISYAELPELAIAPQSSIWINEYNIYSNILVDCDLARFPKESASMDFSKEDSPIHFGNYITYFTEGSDDETVIKNEFYVSNITNYAWPSLLTYEERKKPCQNITNNPELHYSEKYPVKVYDKYLTIDNTNCFYLLYKTTSSETLYKIKYYYYNSYYDGYVNNN